MYVHGAHTIIIKRMPQTGRSENKIVAHFRGPFMRALGFMSRRSAHEDVDKRVG